MKQALRVLLPLAVLCSLLAACGSPAPAASTPSQKVSLKVFAAASLTESFNAIKTQYQAEHPNVTIVYNFNGSQLLVQQIINGAYADIFASADQANMQKASDASLVSAPKTFARNRLTVIVPTANPGNIQNLKDLARKGLKLVMAAPAVPVGKYSLQVLDKMGASSTYGPDYEKSVKGNVVSQEENVKAVLQKVQLGEADAGIVYTTDVTLDAASKVKMIDIPDTFNVIAEYPIAVTKNSTNQDEARAFMQYMLSPAGQAVLNKYHFISPVS